MKSKQILSIIALICESVANVGAFVSPLHTTTPHILSTTSHYGTVRPDASEAIADALRISEEFGATSKQARVAWDIVEEMDSNDSYAAYSSSNAPVTSAGPQDYYDHIRSLSYLLKETSSKVTQMKQLVEQIKDMEINDPSLARIPDDTAGQQLKVALADAKAASEVYGPSSSEATKAWDTLDNCFGPNGFAEECDIDSTNGSTYRYSAAALKAHHLYNAAIDTALLEESINALDMIGGLAKFVSLEKQRLDAEEKVSVGP